MDREVSALQILVGGRDVGVARLIAGYDYPHSVGEVADAGIFQGVELVLVPPSESLTHFYPLPAEYLAACLDAAGAHLLPEYVAVAVVTEQLKVYHQPHYLVVKPHLAVALVLADRGGDENALFL